MKTRILIMMLLGQFIITAQTTHNLDWFAGIGTNVDLTIVSGDTVIWTWTSINHTVENNPAGTSVEIFDSEFLGPIGSTFSHTFTVEGDNDYMCGVHTAANMSGTITVEPSLGIDDETVSIFRIISNPSSSVLHIELPQTISNGALVIHDMLGKNIFNQSINSANTIQLDISQFNDGVYLLTLKSKGIIQTKRFIKN